MLFGVGKGVDFGMVKVGKKDAGVGGVGGGILEEVREVVLGGDVRGDVKGEVDGKGIGGQVKNEDRKGDDQDIVESKEIDGVVGKELSRAANGDLEAPIQEAERETKREITLEAEITDEKEENRD